MPDLLEPDGPEPTPTDAGATGDRSGAADARPSSSARARRLGGRPPHVEPPPAAARRPRRSATAVATAASAAENDLDSDGVSTDGPDPHDEPAEPKKSRAGRNLPAAIAVAAVIAAVFVSSLFTYRPSFGYVVGAAVLYGVWELKQALATAGVRVTLVPLWVGGVAMLFATWLRGPDGRVLAALVTLLGVLAWRVGDGADGFLRDASASAFVLLYLPTLAAFALLLARPDDGPARVLAFAATVVCSDTGGYATGVLFGKHPLAPVVSKAKTWEGFAGSVLWCSTCGILFMVFCFHEAWWKGLLFGLAVVVTATLGDLGESMIKRDIGVKDMGTLLPGHGGVMDRLDSMLPCAAVAYLLLSTFHPA